MQIRKEREGLPEREGRTRRIRAQALQGNRPLKQVRAAGGAWSPRDNGRSQGHLCKSARKATRPKSFCRTKRLNLRASKGVRVRPREKGSEEMKLFRDGRRIMPAVVATAPGKTVLSTAAAQRRSFFILYSDKE